MARPRLLGVKYAQKAKPVREQWLKDAKSGTAEVAREAKTKLKSLATFEARAKANPLAAGEGVQRDRWPKDLKRDYGEVPNVFRFELAERWRGYYSLIGEPGGARIWVLYLWDHATYNRQSGYSKL